MSLPQLPAGFVWDPHFKMGREASELTARLWPNYLVDASDMPADELTFEIPAHEFETRFPAWGIRREADGKLMAFANAVQLTELESLPARGWSFAIEHAARSRHPDTLCLLVANVDPEARGQGLARTLIERAKQAAREFGFQSMIAPVRPTTKREQPFSELKAFLALNKDPWVETHLEAGAEMGDVCAESVEIRASLQKWRQWTGLSLTTSGERVVPGALAPLKVDTHRNIGTYKEPGVWVRYELA